MAFATLEDLARELDALERAHRGGTLRATGNWSAGQVFAHVAGLMECSLDGFPARAPWFIRIPATLLFKRGVVAGKPLPTGVRIPKRVNFLEPDPDTSFEEGLSRLRHVLGRVEAGERFTHPSPVFGNLTHQQWAQIHCGHGALHLGFLHHQ